MMNDKRRYLSRNPSSRRDPIVGADSSRTGNAAKDGYTTRYSRPMPDRPNPHPVPEERYRSEGRSDASRYSEHYACDGLMDESEARMNRLYGPTTGDY